MELNPPCQFSPVCPWIYRSSTPTFPLHSPFLKTLQLRTILSLSAELPSILLDEFCQTNSIHLYHFGSSSTITQEMMKDCLETILDSKNHPILVTDTSGIHEIGVLIGCLRKLQGWNFATILIEYRCFATSRARVTNERFIEMFDIDLISIPCLDNVPCWLRRQIQGSDVNTGGD